MATAATRRRDDGYDPPALTHDESSSVAQYVKQRPFTDPPPACVLQLWRSAADHLGNDKFELDEILDALKCARHFIFIFDDVRGCRFRCRAPPSASAFINEHLADIARCLVGRWSKGTTGLCFCLTIIANQLEATNAAPIINSHVQTSAALGSLFLIFYHTETSLKRRLIRFFQSICGFAHLAAYMNASVSTVTFLDLNILLEPIAELLQENASREEENFKLILNSIMDHFLSCDKQDLTDNGVYVRRICQVMFLMSLQMSTRNLNMLEHILRFMRRLAQKLIVSPCTMHKEQGWSLIHDISINSLKLQFPPVAYIVSGAGLEHTNGKYDLDRNSVLDNGYMKLDGGVCYHRKAWVESLEPGVSAGSSGVGGADNESSQQVAASEAGMEDSNSIETSEFTSSSNSNGDGSTGFGTRTILPELASIDTSAERSVATESVDHVELTKEDMAAKEHGVGNWKYFTLFQSEWSGKSGWFLKESDEDAFTNNPHLGEKSCHSIQYHFHHSSKERLPPHSEWRRLGKDWIGRKWIATPTLEPINLKEAPGGGDRHVLADWAHDNSVVERAFIDFDSVYNVMMVKGSMSLIRAIAPLDRRVFANLASYMNAKVSTPQFPDLCILEHFLGVSRELNEPGKEQDLEMAKGAMSIASAMMKHVASLEKETLAMSKLTREMCDSLLWICSNLSNLSNQADIGFHDTWRSFALKLITSQTKSLVEIGWDNINEIILKSSKLSPPSMSYMVSNAGTEFVNGRYDFECTMWTDKMTGSHANRYAYIRRTPPDNSNSEKILSLFQCTMRSQHTWWFLSEADSCQPGTDKDVDYYQHKSKKSEQSSPPNSGWRTCRVGTDPPPMIVSVSPTIPEESFEYQLSEWAIQNHVIEISQDADYLQTRKDLNKSLITLVWRTHRFSHLRDQVIKKFPWEDLLEVLLDSIPDPLDQNTEQLNAEIIAVTKIVMKNVVSLDEESCEHFDWLTRVSCMRSRLFQIYVRLGSCLIYDMFRFWRDLALKLVKSQSLELRLLGWDEIEQIIKQSKDMSPPPKTFIASSAGVVFTNDNTLEHELAKWSIDHRLVELALGSSAQVEIVPRSTKLITFLAKRCDSMATDMAPNQFCLDRSDIFLAGQTCSNTENMSLLAKLYRLLGSVRDSLPENLTKTVDPIIKNTVMRRIQLDDTILTSLVIGDFFTVEVDTEVDTAGVLEPTEAVDFSNLGKSIGQNSNVKDISFDSRLGEFDNLPIEFLRGLKQNTSIQSLSMYNCDISDSAPLSVLRSFEERKSDLLSLSLCGCDLRDGRVNLLLANLSLFRCLRSIEFHQNRIDCELLTRLTVAIRESGELQTLSLEGNDIGMTGCIVLANYLADPQCNIAHLQLDENEIDNNCTNILANALAQNTTLTSLSLDENADITENAWDDFAHILCDTSNLNAIYNSNHTLKSIEGIENRTTPEVEHLDLYLQMNESVHKGHVAMKKVFHHNHNFDMEPFFGLSLKILPVALNWFQKAKARASSTDLVIDTAKLSAVYQFSQAMPLLLLPPSHNRKEKKRKRNELSV